MKIIKIKLLLLYGLSNLIVYLIAIENSPNSPQMKNINYRNDPKLTTLKLPIKTHFSWPKELLLHGVEVVLKDEDGLILTNKGYLYSQENLSFEKTIIATIQLPKLETQNISRALIKNSFFYVGPKIIQQENKNETSQIKEIIF